VKNIGTPSALKKNFEKREKIRGGIKSGSPRPGTYHCELRGKARPPRGKRKEWGLKFGRGAAKRKKGSAEILEGCKAEWAT